MKLQPNQAPTAPSANSAAITRRRRPASTMTSAPAMAISAAVPRSGCTTTRLTGTKSARRAPPATASPAAAAARAGTRRHHRHRELHELARLEAEQSEVEPALRAHADVADRRHHQEQQAAARVQPGRGAAQEVGVDLRQQQHRRGAQCQARAGAHHGGQVLAGGAVEHHETVGGDQRQAHHQRPIDLQRKQHARRAGQGAPGAGAGSDLLVDHVAGFTLPSAVSR